MSDDTFQTEVLPLFEEHRADWLSEARRMALELGKSGHAITIDDVRAVVPPPAGQDPRVMGAVFTRADWVKVGFANSNRKTCHGRPVGLFKRREA